MYSEKTRAFKARKTMNGIYRNPSQNFNWNKETKMKLFRNNRNIGYKFMKKKENTFEWYDKRKKLYVKKTFDVMKEEMNVKKKITLPHWYTCLEKFHRRLFRH